MAAVGPAAELTFASSTNAVVPLPAGSAAGHVLSAALFHDAAAAVALVKTGWSLLDTQVSSGSLRGVTYLLTRDAPLTSADIAAGNGGTISWTGARNRAMTVLAHSGRSATPESVQGANTSATASPSGVALSVTPGAAGADVVSFVERYNGGAVTMSGFTTRLADSGQGLNAFTADAVSGSTVATPAGTNDQYWHQAFSWPDAGGGSAPATGTASTTATATGAGAAPDTGTATATATASGSVGGGVTGTSSATATASGSASGQQAATGTAQIAVIAAGSAAGSMAGTASATATAAGSAGARAAGTATITVTAAGTAHGAGVIKGMVVGPVAGPAVARTVTGPAVRPGRSVVGPALARTVTGPAVSRTVTGPGV